MTNGIKTVEQLERERETAKEIRDASNKKTLNAYRIKPGVYTDRVSTHKPTPSTSKGRHLRAVPAAPSTSGPTAPELVPDGNTPRDTVGADIQTDGTNTGDDLA